MKKIRFLLGGLVALAVVQALVYYPQLPDTMASHFGPSGRADGSMSKPVFFTVDLAMVGLMALIFGAFSAIRWPNWMINLPHKDYWLAAQRRRETFDDLNRRLLVFGCATLLLLLVVMQWVIDANLDGSRFLAPGPMWALLVGYFLLTIVWVVRLLLRYTRLPSAAKSPPTTPR